MQNGHWILSRICEVPDQIPHTMIFNCEFLSYFAIENKITKFISSLESPFNRTLSSHNCHLHNLFPSVNFTHKQEIDKMAAHLKDKLFSNNHCEVETLMIDIFILFLDIFWIFSSFRPFQFYSISSWSNIINTIRDASLINTTRFTL